MTPLSNWFCDSCGQTIAGPTSGNVVWRWGADLIKRDFAIVHKGKVCDGDRSMQSAQISELLGPDGASWLLAMLDPGPLSSGRGQASKVDSSSFVDVFRRLHTPYYEEARQHFGHEHVIEDFSDANEGQPYTEWSLRSIAEHQD